MKGKRPAMETAKTVMVSAALAIVLDLVKGNDVGLPPGGCTGVRKGRSSREESAQDGIGLAFKVLHFINPPPWFAVARFVVLVEFGGIAVLEIPVGLTRFAVGRVPDGVFVVGTSSRHATARRGRKVGIL